MVHKQKTLLFLPNLHSGGAQRVFLRLYRALRKFYPDVILVVAQKKGELVAAVEKEDLPVVFLNSSRLLTSFFSLKRFIKTEKPRAIFSTMNYVNVFVGFVVWLSRYKGMVIMREANTMQKLRNQGVLDIRDRLFLFLMRFFYKRAHAVVANAVDIATDLDYFKVVPKSRVRIIPNPVIDEMFIRNLQEPISHPWLTNNSNQVVLGIGRFSEQKNFKLLIEAFSIAQKQLSSLRLMILGSGPLRSQYEALLEKHKISEKAYFPGYVENPIAYMREALVFVSPSNWEGMPNVLIEALGAGCKIIATDCPGATADVLDNGRYGVLISPNDVNSLASAIINSLGRENNPDLLKTHAMKYSAEKIALEYYALLNRNLPQQV